MQGVSRASAAAALDRLESLLGNASEGAGALAEDLFGVTGALAESPGLRRALTDPSREGPAKADLLDRLLRGKVGAATLDLLAGLVRSRWSASGDLTDVVERLAVTAELAVAQRAGRLDDVEDELFRFARVVAGDAGLRDAFSARTEGAERKAALVRRLLPGAAPETVRLAVQAAVAPRGLRTEQVLEQYVQAVAARRNQLVAEVRVAHPISAAQRDRLAALLQRVYGRPVRLNIDLDPQVVGGVHVRVGGEVVDGSMAGRLAEARRRLAG
jgi:F-type H+-transporting ATPase subunit delta